MKNQNNLVKSLSFVAICMFLFACADSAEKKHEQKEKEVEEVVETETMEVEEEASFMLPSPIQIAAIFNRSGLGFESGLTNPNSNLSNYNTKTAKYLNFGIYSADLAYVVLNGEQQASIDYLNSVRKLADEIGMPSIFGSGELMESFEKNIGNKDTVLNILTIIKSRTDEYLEENDDKSKEAVFFAAAWVEGMYLGANSSSDMSKVTPRLIEQMTILENILSAVNKQTDASLDLGFLIDGLDDLHVTFEGFQEIKKLNTDTELDLEDIILTPEELVTMTEKITAIRTQIING